MLEHKRYQELLEQLKILFSMFDNDQNENYEKVLKFSLSKVVQDVANYLNIPVDELPEELDYTIVSMVVQVIKTHGLLDPDDSSNVQSLNEGDTSVTFKSVGSIYSELQTVNPITDNYINVLNNFRRLPE